MSSETTKRVEELRRLVEHHNHRYHALDDPGGLEHLRAHRLGDPLETQAGLDRLPGVGEVGSAQRGGEAVQELGERLDLRPVIDGHQTEGGVGRGVEASEGRPERVAHDDWALDPQRCHDLMDLFDEALERLRRAGALSVRRQVDGHGPHRTVQPVEDRAPGASVEGEPVEEDHRGTGALHVESEPCPPLGWCCHANHDLSPFRINVT